MTYAMSAGKSSRRQKRKSEKLSTWNGAPRGQARRPVACNFRAAPDELFSTESSLRHQLMLTDF